MTVDARWASALYPQATKNSGAAALLAAADNARTDMQRLIAAERGERVCDELERIERHDEWEGS